jgi:hypothetical protein
LSQNHWRLTSADSDNDFVGNEVDETFAPGQLEVGPLTDGEHAAIMADGSLINDPLYDRDEVLRWRRYLRVASDWHRCPACETWTERPPNQPCRNCGALHASTQ